MHQLHLVFSVFLYIISSASSQFSSTANFNRSQEEISKDLNIEKSENCSCVPYYLCDDDNYVITSGAGIFDPRIGMSNSMSRIKCSHVLYNCCKHKNSDSDLKVLPKNPVITNISVWIDPNNTRAGCGYQRSILNARILDTSDFSSTIIGAIPWIVAIFKEKSQNIYNFKCAGSLIKPNAVLTSTHCIVSTSAESLKVVVTGESLLSPLDTDNPQDSERRVTKIIKHPEYYSGGLYNDIAILILNDNFIVVKSPINTICLPHNNDLTFDPSKCVAAGWGTGKLNDQSDRPLRKVRLPLVDSGKCQEVLRSNTRLGPDFQLDESFMCAGGEIDSDTCKGDGGGPLMCSDSHGSRYVQIGIVSWGIDCGKNNVPGVYTDIRKFGAWIKEVLDSNV